MSSPRIFFAGLFHESHSFLSEHTGLADFEQAGLGTDRPIDVPGSPMAAAIEEATNLGASALPGPYFWAMPSGTVEAVVVTTWMERFEQAWEQCRDTCDGIFLVLHGALVTDQDTDPEASLISWIRSLPKAGSIPIHAVLDLHGNLSKAFTEQVNCPVAYRKNPHTDATDAARNSVRLLIDSLQNKVRLQAYWQGTAIVWPPSGTGTAAEPMRSLEQCARALESQPGIKVVNVFAGYSYSDKQDAGVSFSLVADESFKPQQAAAALAELARLAQQTKAAGIPEVHQETHLLDLLSHPADGPIVVAEPSDNIGAGAPGDCTGLLRIFLKHSIKGAGVILNDPQAVALLNQHQPDDLVQISMGGKGYSLDPGPLVAEVQLVRCFNGQFELEDPRSHLASMAGTNIDMGPCALVNLQGITVLLSSLKTPPFDLGQWRVAGIDPAKLRVIGVKAAVAHRQAYDPIASAHLTIDTKGPCQIDLSEIPFRHIRRPVFPLDNI